MVFLMKPTILPALMASMIWLGTSGRGWVTIIPINITVLCAEGASIPTKFICGFGKKIVLVPSTTAHNSVSGVSKLK